MLLEQLELNWPILKKMPGRPRRRHDRAPPQINETAFERRKPARRPLPDHLPRERIVYPLPAASPCCGGTTFQDRRGRDRDAGAHPASVESDPARAREVLLPCLRSDHAAAGALTPNHACQIAANSDPFSRPRTTPLMEPVTAGRNWWRGHSRSELPGQDVAGEVLEHVVGQAPTDELEVGKVGLPKLVGRRRGLAKWSAAFIRMKASWLHPERLLPKFHRDALRRFSTPTLLPATSL